MRGNLKIAAVALCSAIAGGVVATYLQPHLPPRAVRPAPAPSPDLAPRPAPSDAAPREPGRTVPREPAVAVAEEVGPAVVGITTEEVLRDFFGRRFVEPRASGSGVIFDARGHIVTNYHVVEGADRVVVALADGRRLAGSIRGADPATDLAVIRVDAEGLPAASFADSDQVKVGETAIAIGNPLGMEFERSVTEGIVSGIRSTLYGQEAQGFDRVFQLIQTDAAINPGNSGGALVNADGLVIGINTLKIGETRNVEGMGFAIPANTVKRVIDDLVRYGEVRRARLGVIFGSRERVEALTGRTVDRGLVIVQVAPDGPAGRAGLQPMDVIVALDGQPVNETVDAVRVLEMKRPGDRLAVRYTRDGRERTADLTLDVLRLPR